MAEGTLRTVSDLMAEDLIQPESAAGLEAVAERYAIAITPTACALINASDPHDPIAAQYLPSAAELIEHPAERPTPSVTIPIHPWKGSFTAILTGCS